MNYFIIIVNDQAESNSTAREIYANLMVQSMWGFGPNTQNLKKITTGDRLVFYLAGKHGQVFAGTAEVASPPALTDREEYRSTYWFKLSKVHIWDQPRPIQDYINELEFIKRPTIYGTYLQGGSRSISKIDYLTIISPIYDKMVEDETEVLMEEKEDTLADKRQLFQEASDFVNTKESHIFENSPHKIRIESKRQKKITAELEDYKCQLCGWSLEWVNSRGKKSYRIDVDHIIDKAKGGTEEISNLWVLCPNCHAKKTIGVITVDLLNKKVRENGQEVAIKSDNHLNWKSTQII